MKMNLFFTPFPKGIPPFLKLNLYSGDRVILIYKDELSDEGAVGSSDYEGTSDTHL